MPGTIIHGTLLSYDLIQAFVGELETQGGAKAGYGDLIAEAHETLALGADKVNYPTDYEGEADQIGFVLERLEDALNECTPEGHYFGAHEGDGSDFGFWPIHEED